MQTVEMYIVKSELEDHMCQMGMVNGVWDLLSKGDKSGLYYASVHLRLINLFKRYYHSLGNIRRTVV